MEDLLIEKTKSSPCIRFNVREYTLCIEGESYPENTFKFYEPLFQLLEEALSALPETKKFIVSFRMPYINTSSSKCVMMILDKLEEAHLAGRQAEVRWAYERGNEMALECAEEFKEDLTLPFEIYAVDALF